MSDKDNLTEVLESLNDDDLKKDAETVRDLLKVAKHLAEDVFGEDTTFNDAVTVYSILKAEKITRLTEERLKLMGSNGALPPGLELVKVGQAGPFGGNGGIN